MSLAGKKLLIIGGAFQHCKLVEAAHNLGVITYVVDYLPVEKAPAKQISDYHYEYNITDYDLITDICKKEGIDGVLASHLDACQNPYQVVCERMGFPCFGTKEQYHILTDKTAFIRACVENDVDVIPQYGEDAFENDNPSVEYPVFVKPCDSRGSRGQTICYSYDTVKEAITFAKEESKSGKVVIEKYMGNCPEFTMSYLFVDGEAVLIRTGDRYVGAKENNMNKSAVLGKSPSVNVNTYLSYEAPKVVGMLKRIGIKNGPVFMQGFVDGKKVRFFDPGLRFPGCEYDRMYEKATGINICEWLVEFALTGSFPREALAADRYAGLNGKAVGSLFIVLRPGVIDKIIGLEDVKASEKVVSVAQRYYVGDRVGEFYNVNQRFGEIAIVCDDTTDLKNTIRWIYRTLLILDENGTDMKMSMFNTDTLRENA